MQSRPRSGLTPPVDDSPVDNAGIGSAEGSDNQADGAEDSTSAPSLKDTTDQDDAPALLFSDDQQAGDR